MIGARAATVAALGAAATMLAACTSSGRAADNPVITPPPSTPSSAAPPSSAPPSSTPASSSTPPSSPPTSSTPPSHTRPASTGACSAAQLRLELFRGGAELGKQYAQVVFTNTSSAACTLDGYPFAQLVLGGQLIGSPAAHASGAMAVVRLSPGAQAQATLIATSNCNAPLSDHVRVGVPGSTVTQDLPDRLRRCTLSVQPVQPA